MFPYLSVFVVVKSVPAGILVRLRPRFNVVHKLSAQNFIWHTAKVIHNEVLPSHKQRQGMPVNALLLAKVLFTLHTLHLAAAHSRALAQLRSTIFCQQSALCASPSLHPCLRQRSFLITWSSNFDHQLLISFFRILITSPQLWLLMFISSFLLAHPRRGGGGVLVLRWAQPNRILKRLVDPQQLILEYVCMSSEITFIAATSSTVQQRTVHS